jgi:hypothetical protein
MRSYKHSLAVASFVVGLLLAGPVRLLSQTNAATPYNTSAEVTLKGTVVSISTVLSGGQWGGLHLVLKTENQTIPVQVGPPSFLAQNKMTLVRGDQIEVIGAKGNFLGTDAVMVREITKGNQHLRLRDAKGMPLWRGAKRW